MHLRQPFPWVRQRKWIVIKRENRGKRMKSRGKEKSQEKSSNERTEREGE